MNLARSIGIISIMVCIGCITLSLTAKTPLSPCTLISLALFLSLVSYASFGYYAHRVIRDLKVKNDDMTDRLESYIWSIRG